MTYLFTKANWKLEDLGWVKHEKRYNCCEETYPSLEARFSLRRETQTRYDYTVLWPTLSKISRTFETNSRGHA
jgi:hypothetical protein